MINKQFGFTLLELIFVISVVGIVVSFALPSYKETIQNNRLITKTNELVTILSYARGEAVKRRTRVVLCVSSDQQNCLDSTDWGLGYMLFVDEDDDDIRDDPADDIVAINEHITGGINLRTVGFASLKLLVFNSRGQIASQGNFIFCDERDASHAKAVIVNVIGRVRRATDNDADNTVNGYNGVNVTCP